MVVKTNFKLTLDNGEIVKDVTHQGIAGFTATLIVDENNDKQGTAMIEYAMNTKPAAIALLKELLIFFHEQAPGVVENAMQQFADEAGIVKEVDGQKFAHFKYKENESSS